MMAVWRRGALPWILAHSDQGDHDTNEQLQQLLDAVGITCSMSRSGNVRNTAILASFFPSLKPARISRKTNATRAVVRADVLGYMDRFYHSIQ